MKTTILAPNVLKSVLLSSQGPSGPAGPEGPAGADGDPGPVGPQGPAGPADGPPGPQGPVGAQGPAGVAGPQGVAGAAGAQGLKGDTGEPGPQGAAGVDGNDGAQGPAGAAGAQGPAGAAGAQGPAGAAGAQGPKGDDGEPGAVGPAGAAGAQGPQGVAGADGDPGPAGPQGAAGAAGTNGIDGDDGAPGLSAYQVALDNGFIGNEAAWLASLQGPPGEDGSGGGSAIIDKRKLAPYYEGGIEGKIVFHIGDSTSWQLDPLGKVLISGEPAWLAERFPVLRSTVQINKGINGAFYTGFVNNTGAPPEINLQNVVADPPDVAIVSFLLNDTRIGIGIEAPAYGEGTGDDWRDVYGSPGQVGAALKFQRMLQKTVTDLKAAKPNICIIFRMPNAITIDCNFRSAGIDSQHMMDLYRLIYRGDAALGVPSPESFGENVIVFDTMAVAMGQKAYVSQNFFLTNDPPGNDGLHNSPAGYDQILWPIGLLMAGPAQASFSNQEEADRAATTELAIAHGWQADKEYFEAVTGSPDYEKIYTCGIALNGFGIVDVGMGPDGPPSLHHATGTDGVGAGIQDDRNAGLAIDDVVHWHQMDPERLTPVRNLGSYSMFNAIRYAGTDIRDVPVPTDLEGNGDIYRHRFAHSTAMRRNTSILASGMPHQKDQAYQNAYRFQVVSASVGSMVVRGIQSERGAKTGDDASTHAWTQADVLSLAGVECGDDTDDSKPDFGLLLNTATFAVSGREVTITMAGIDFTNRCGDQGFCLSNT